MAVRQIPATAGAVYVLTTSGGKLVKVGMVFRGGGVGLAQLSRRATQRARRYAREMSLGQALHLFSVTQTDDPLAVEYAAHHALAEFRLPRVGKRGHAHELFQTDPETARRVVEAAAADVAATMQNRWRRPATYGEGFVVYV